MKQELDCRRCVIDVYTFAYKKGSSMSMHAELRTHLEQLSDDLHAGRIDRAALFWLRTFVAAASEQDGQVRSDRWIEAGLEAARKLPGLSATALAPRQQLVGRYDLFRFVRLRDEAEFSGPGLADL